MRGLREFPLGHGLHPADHPARGEHPARGAEGGLEQPRPGEGTEHQAQLVSGHGLIRTKRADLRLIKRQKPPIRRPAFFALMCFCLFLQSGLFFYSRKEESRNLYFPGGGGDVLK